jgi:hypothetical protein
MAKKYQLSFLLFSSMVSSDIPVDAARVCKWLDTRTKETSYGVEARIKGENTWAHVAQSHFPTLQPRIVIFHEEAFAIALVEKIKDQMKEAANGTDKIRPGRTQGPLRGRNAGAVEGSETRYIQKRGG